MSTSIRIRRDAPLGNTFGLPVHAGRLLEVADVDALPDALRQAGRDALLVGGGSNLLFVAPRIDNAVRVLDATIEAVGDDGDHVIVRASAGANWHEFVLRTLASGWYGLENLAQIPGTVGASPIQNIGAYGVEVMDLIEAVQVHDRGNGETRWWRHEECGFSYRHSAFKIDPQRHAVLRVDFRLSRKPALRLGYAGIGEELARRGIEAPSPRDVAEAVIRIRSAKLPDPARIGNAGSFFKNPLVPLAVVEALQARFPAMPVFRGNRDDERKLSAAWLIDQCGWKGHREGDAGVSAEHALVLVNHGRASGASLLELARAIAASVHERFGIDIEPEPRLVGATW